MQTQNNKIKYFLYARKSSESEDRQVASIESQINALRELARKEKLNIINIFSESKSAKEPGRPIFNKMIERIHKNEAGGIICWKLDRLARNPVDGGSINWMLQSNTIKHIKTYERSYYPTDNVLMMAVEFGMANQFIRDLSQNTKRGLKTKAERGWYPGFAPVGYTHNPIKRKGDKEVIRDNERYDLVKKMFRLMLCGNNNPIEILDKVNNEWGFKMPNGKPMHKSCIYRILNNPFYYGQFEYPKGSNNWYQGNHEPMINEQEYDKIQFLLGRKGKARPINHKFAFTGMIKCEECGAMITAEQKTKYQKNGKIHNYTYYHCTKRINPDCSQKSIEQKELEKQVDDILGRLEIPEEFYQWAVDGIKEESNKEKTDRGKILSQQQRSYSNCIKKIDNLIEMRANNEITQDEFLNKKTELLKEKENLHKLLGDTDSRISSWIEKAEALFNFAKDAKIKFNTGSPEDKKMILNTLGSNLYLKDRKLSISIQKPLLLIQKVAKEVRTIHNRLEPLKKGKNKIKYEDFYSKSPILLARWDDFRTLKWLDYVDSPDFNKRVKALLWDPLLHSR